MTLLAHPPEAGWVFSHNKTSGGRFRKSQYNGHLGVPDILHPLFPSSVPVKKVNSSQYWSSSVKEKKKMGRNKESCLMLYCLHEIGWCHFHCLKASSDAL